jgi:hypothetical protein
MTFLTTNRSPLSKVSTTMKTAKSKSKRITIPQEIEPPANTKAPLEGAARNGKPSEEDIHSSNGGANGTGKERTSRAGDF